MGNPVGQDWWDRRSDTIVKSIKVVDLNHYHVHREKFYSVGHLFATVADDSYVRVLVINGHNYDLHIGFEVVAEGNSYIKGFRGGTFSNNGTGLTEMNHVGKSARTSNAEGFHTPTVSGAGTQIVPTTLIVGGSGPKTSGGGAKSLAEYIIPSADNFYVEVQNKGGATKDISINISWYEEDTQVNTTTTTTTTTSTTTTTTA